MRIEECLPNKTVVTEFESGAKITVVANSSFLTIDVQDMLRREQEAGSDLASDLECQLYSRVFVSWDLTDNDDKPIGTDPDSIRKVPIAIINRVFEAVKESFRPNAESVPASDVG